MVIKMKPKIAGPASNSLTIAANTNDDPDIARLRTVLVMLAEGRTQKEIADHFHKDPRTIRRWFKTARSLKLALSDRLTPKEALANFLFSIAEQRANLFRMKREAMQSGDNRQVLRCIKELLRLEAMQMAALQRIGLFEHFVPDSSYVKVESPSERYYREVDNMLFPPPSNSADGAESAEPDTDSSEDEDDEETLY